MNGDVLKRILELRPLSAPKIHLRLKDESIEVPVGTIATYITDWNRTDQSPINQYWHFLLYLTSSDLFEHVSLLGLPAFQFLPFF
jgi:hypothetical protein